MGGSLGSNALLVINGKPKNLAVGATVEGVRLLSVSTGGAVVEVEGRRLNLALGGAQVNLGGKPRAETSTQIVLSMETGGHFFANGSINDKAVRFMVDTGATTISLSQSEADRLGLDYKNGQRGYVTTANGVVPAWRTSLASVRIGDVLVYDVDATIMPAAMPVVLLGNSFLNRFLMRRESDRMTLDKRF